LWNCGLFSIRKEWYIGDEPERATTNRSRADGVVVCHIRAEGRIVAWRVMVRTYAGDESSWETEREEEELAYA
jgi:hypothetical protein